MIIPFRRGQDEHPGAADALTDRQLLDRLRGLDGETAADQTLLARGRVWERLVAEHPSLAQTATPTRRPAPVAAGITAAPARRLPTPNGRRSTGGWRAAIDVAAVAALVIGLVLGARGVGIMPPGGNPNPLGTQSVAAAPATATGTETLAMDEAGTNRQPGPGPQVMPIAEWTGEYADAVAYGNDRLYTTISRSEPRSSAVSATPAYQQFSPVTAYALDPFAPVWTTNVDGSVSDLSVSSTSVTVVSNGLSEQTQLPTVVSLDATSGMVRWSVMATRYVLALASNDETVLLTTLGPDEGELTLQALDGSTGAPVWSRDIPTSTFIQAVLADSQIAYGTETGAVHLLDSETGEDIWVAHTGANSISTAPVIGSDTVYAITEDLVLFAFDRQTGEERWGTGIGAPGVPPLSWSGPPDEVGFGGEQAPYIHYGSEPMLALAGDQLTVQFIWTSSDQAALSSLSTPLPFDSMRYDLVSLDATTGTENWRQEAVTEADGETDWYANQVVVDGGQIYVTTTDAIQARSLSDGSPIWTLELPFPTRSSPVVVAGDMYLVSTTVLEVLREPVSMPGTATPAATPTVKVDADMGSSRS